MFITKHIESSFFILLAIVVISFAYLLPSNSAGFQDVGKHWLEITTLEIRINSINDDAEELNKSGDMYLNSNDLKLTYDDFLGGNQTVGLRFNNIQIDRGAKIHNAYIQFTVNDDENSNPCSLTFTAQAVDNAEAFTSEPNNITGRWPITSARVTWTPPDWVTIGSAGYDQITPRITAVIQEISSRPGWVRGNSIVIIITGTGSRATESYDGSPADAPLLHVEFGPADTDVNFKDFTVIAKDWLEIGSGLAGDINRDNVVDHNDLKILTASWLCGCDQIKSYSQYPYSVYFTCNPNVADASINNFHQETLDYFWDYIAELENTGIINIPEPIALQECNEPEYCPYIYLTDEESKRILAAKTAHSVWLDKNDMLPWAITEYSDDELEGLFNRELLFSTSGSQHYYYSVVDHSPSEVYGYILDKQLLQNDLFITFYAVLDDLRADFRHGISGLGDPTSTAYTIKDALTTYAAYNRRVSRKGCHSMTRITLGILRSINIPGEEINDGTWFEPGHSSAVWPTLETVLPHGDNIYNALIKATPTDEFLPTFTFFNENLDTEPCGDSIPCLSHRHMALNGITYPSDYTLARCCDPNLYGYESCEDYLDKQYGAYLTQEELDSAVTALLELCETE